MARWGALFFAAGGLFGLVSLAVPDTAVDDRTLLLAVSIASLAVAALLIAVSGRMPMAGFHLAVAAGSAAAGVGVYAWGSESSYAPLPYAWVMLFAFYFFTLPAALAHLGLASAGLADAAHRDSLTELLNRRGFEEVFDMELERARRAETPLSLIVGDLDRFKRVNDEHGHTGGDAALKRVARAIGNSKRGFDTAARIGGEEFAVLAANSDEHGAYMLAERIRAEIEQGGEGLTVSFGIATFPLHGGSSEALILAADQALYAAKHLGRNRTVISSAEVAGILARPPRGREEAYVDLAALLSLAEALDVRDSGSVSHCHRVGRLAELTARELGLAPETVERVRLAGILHDIGRVGIPDALIRRAGPLTEDEYSLVRGHPEIGARMVETAHFDDIRSWILLHHTRPDGGGYPAGQAWERVPLEARILAVADAYEAMTSDRPYRDALALDDAAALLRDAAGRQFDARVVDALLRAV